METLRTQYIDKLERELAKLVSPDIALSREVLGTVERVRLSRTLDDGSIREMLISWAGGTQSGLPLETYSIMGSWYANADPMKNTDGRQWGDTVHTLEVVKQWLLDLSPEWPQLPKYK